MNHKQYRIGIVWKILYLVILLISGITVLCGCSVEEKQNEKMEDLPYTVVEEEDLPEELKNNIEEKKASDFKLTYKNNEYLYIVRGYGEQETGGYSICVKNCYLTNNSILCDTELIGPRKGETVQKNPSYPYLVIKTELREENVIFE